MQPNHNLSSSVKLGVHNLSNRIAMASMSCLSEEYSLSDSKTLDYYVKRASAGLIITDPTLISPSNKFLKCPGIYADRQVKEWRKITQAVHDRHGKVFLQLWYDDNQKKKKQALSNLKQLFRRAAQNALAADFDGVEIHAALGYLIDCYPQSNLESDRDLERQTELLFSIVEEVISVWDENRVGVRISPVESFLGSNSDYLEIFYYLFDAFNFYDVAYIHLIEPDSSKLDRQIFPTLISVIRSVYHGTIISSCQDNFDRGREAIALGNVDLVSFDKLVAV